MTKSKAQEPKIYPRSSHSISRKSVDTDALSVMYRLVRYGFKGYLVGGGVRDLLLGKNPKDFDVVTDATPKQVKNTFRNCRIIGRRFKLAHVFFPGNHIIEVATFRDAVEFDSIEESEDQEGIQNNKRQDENRFGTELTDAFRRDVTINALFYDVSRFAIVDYVGGMEDLRQKLVRVIGKPSERYAEDPVRMLRVLRYAARAGFSVEEESFAAIMKQHSLLATTSKMRLFEEYKKELVSGYLAEVLYMWRAAGVTQYIAPELKSSHGVGFVPLDAMQPISRFDQTVRNRGEGRLISTGVAFGFLVYVGARLRGELEALQVLSAEDYARYFIELGAHRQIPHKDRMEAQTIVEVLLARNSKRLGITETTEAGVRQCGEWLEIEVESQLDAAAGSGGTISDEAPKRKRRRRRRKPRVES